MSQLENESPFPATATGASNPAEADREGAALGEAADSPNSVKKPRRFEKGGSGWPIFAAALGIVVMLIVTCAVAASGGVTGDAFINALAVTSVSIAGVGTVLRAMAHGANTPFERQVDHAGKLLTVVALSSGFTGAIARLNATPGTLSAGMAVALIVSGLVMAAVIVLEVHKRRRIAIKLQRRRPHP
ncbi:MAG: hypothetical protein FJW64_00410 [Actinobacteria bacterium]|nr:hypothetical protein [Actinomycetota bacterium]